MTNKEFDLNQLNKIKINLSNSKKVAKKLELEELCPLLIDEYRSLNKNLNNLKRNINKYTNYELLDNNLMKVDQNIMTIQKLLRFTYDEVLTKNVELHTRLLLSISRGQFKFDIPKGIEK